MPRSSPSSRTAFCASSTAYVALYLRASEIERIFFYYVAGMAVVAFVGALLLPELKRHGYLDGDGEVEANVGRRSHAA